MWEATCTTCIYFQAIVKTHAKNGTLQCTHYRLLCNNAKKELKQITETTLALTSPKFILFAAFLISVIPKRSFILR